MRRRRCQAPRRGRPPRSARARPKPSSRSALTALAGRRVRVLPRPGPAPRAARRVERALFAHGERKREVRELAEHARAHRVGARLAARSRRRPCAAAAAGAEPKPSEYGTTKGLRSRAPARSPSTIAASNGPCTLRRRSRRAPGVAAAATARRDEHDRALGLARGEHARELEQRGGTDSSASRTARRASRWARITIGVALVEPGRCGDHRGERALAVDRLAFEVARAHREAAAGRAAEPFERARHVARRAPRRRGCRGAGPGTRPPGSAVRRTRACRRTRRARASR